jgi:predicted nucleic acid-binding protein
MKVIVDSYAWIEYFEGSKKGLLVKEIIENENNDLFCSALTVSEIVSKSERAGKDSNQYFEALQSLSRILKIDENVARKAGKKHAAIRKKLKNFGLADAFILVQGEKEKAKILSGDQHFKKMKNTIFIGD